MMSGIVISLTMIFVSMQKHRMNTDFLTGVYNRHGLDIYMIHKINTSSENKTFSAILLDIDNFKSINDTYGHNTGDSVLEYSITLLKSCLRPNDFIARYGGDEFYIILNISSSDDLEATVRKINNCIHKYNVYDYQTHMTVEQFQQQVDLLMYKNKRAKKENDSYSIKSICNPATDYS
jgi:diguanylate cyclase (GGDEF)-like protein